MLPLAVAKIRANLATLAKDPDGLARDLSARISARAPAFVPSMLADALKNDGLLVAKLNRVARVLDQPVLVRAELEPLQPSDRRDGNTQSDYVAVAEALLDTLQARLSSEFDEEARSAWATAFVLVADVEL